MVGWEVPRTEAPWGGSAGAWWGARCGVSVGFRREMVGWGVPRTEACLLYTSDAADDTPCVDL
eukprot:419820-Pyramimonas_sp.AAC.1